jgi:hypothetical protein
VVRQVTHLNFTAIVAFMKAFKIPFFPLAMQRTVNVYVVIPFPRECSMRLSRLISAHAGRVTLLLDIFSSSASEGPMNGFASHQIIIFSQVGAKPCLITCSPLPGDGPTSEKDHFSAVASNN